MRYPLLTLCALLGSLTAPAAALAQDAGALDATQRAALVNAMARELEDKYVFPELGTRMALELRANLKAGAYDTVTSEADLASLITRQLQAASSDKHLRVSSASARASGSTNGARRRPPRVAYGRTERLAGNVAYIEISSFGFAPDEVREETERIFNEAADADALILDVRSNGGGSPQMVALVISYLLGDAPVHINSFYNRGAEETVDFYTDPNVRGRKFGPTKPVYVLTSERTFSAAEEFAYNLRTLQRATLVGETTGGGANPGGLVALPHGFAIFVPTGRAINPITKTNWEGVGVQPHLPTAADDALDAALEHARRKATS